MVQDKTIVENVNVYYKFDEDANQCSNIEGSIVIEQFIKVDIVTPDDIRSKIKRIIDTTNPWYKFWGL